MGLRGAGFREKSHRQAALPKPTGLNKKMANKKKTEEIIIENEVEETTTDSSTDEIEVGDPQLLRPVELPLVVKLPADASKAQVEFAKVLNAYAYKNPVKWKTKKDVLIKQLKALKNAPDPIENENARLVIGTRNKLSV